MLQKQVVSGELLELIKTLQKENILKNYILAGGTALALQLGHRTSTDIDLFGNKKDNLINVFNILKEKFDSFEILRIEKNILQLIINKIKVDIVNTNQILIDKPILKDDIRYFTKNDIAAMKLNAILYRNIPRDYIDIAYLLKDISLTKMFNLYKEKYKKDDVIILKRKLLFCNEFSNEEWFEGISMLNNKVKILDIPKIIEKNIKKHNLTIGIDNKIKAITKTVKKKSKKTGL